MKKIAKKLFITTAVLTSVVISALTTAQAHRMWMLPSTFTLSGSEQWVTVDGAVSNDLFFPNHVPLSLKDVSVTAPDGTIEAPLNGATGKFRTTFDVKLTQQGTYKIAENGSLFFASWKEGDKRKRRRGSFDDIMAIKKDVKGDVEVFYSSRRVETFVTLGAPTLGAFKTTSQGLEMVPVTHPNDIFVGEKAEFKFVIDGKPAQNIEIMIIKGNDRYRDKGGELKIKTNKEGVVSFTIPKAGRYWLSAHYRSKGLVNIKGQKMKSSTGYVATFEVLSN